MADLAAVPLAEDAAQAETVAEKLSRIRAVVSAARANAEAEAAETFVDADLVSDEIAGEDAPFEEDATELEIAEALAAFDGEEDGDEENGDEAVADLSGDHVEAAADEAEEDTWAEAEFEDDVESDLEDETVAEVEEAGEERSAWSPDANDPELAEPAAAEAEAEMAAGYAPAIAGDALDEDEIEVEPTVAEAAADAVEDVVADEADVVSGDAEDAIYGRVVKLTRPEAEAGREEDAWGAEDDEDDEDDEDEAVAAERVAAEDEEDWASFDDEEDDDLDDAEEHRHEAAWTAPSAMDEDDLDDEDDAFEGAPANVSHGLAGGLDDDPIAAEIRATLGAELAAKHADATDFDDEEADEDEDRDDAALDDETAKAARKWSWDDEDEDDDEPFDGEAAAEAGAIAARDRLGPLSEPEGDAADVDRLLEKTNSQMAETEGSRRRSAIAHLKAAVAATKADRLLKRVSWREKTDAEVQTQYRDDLAQVVRPRRPSEAAAETPRERPKPIGEAKSPLMLVSELRVDSESAGVLTPIRPRRIQNDEDAEVASDMEGSSYEDAARFAEFAEKMGAKDLTDLLEAAAAYAAFVENRPHFSRPQLMKRVARYEAGGDFTREAGLRSFGQLLRQGKIRKLKRGQFTVADTTRFNPEARIAGE
jgi:hypothetical protein